MILVENSSFAGFQLKCDRWRDGPTDGPMEGRTNGQTDDTPSYRDARTHLIKLAHLFLFLQNWCLILSEKKSFSGVYMIAYVFSDVTEHYLNSICTWIYQFLCPPVRPSVHSYFYTVLPKITSRDAKINSVVWSPVCSHCPLLCLRLISITCLLNYFCSFKYQSAYSWSPYCLTNQSWSP